MGSEIRHLESLILRVMIYDLRPLPKTDNKITPQTQPLKKAPLAISPTATRPSCPSRVWGCSDAAFSGMHSLLISAQYHSSYLSTT